MSRCSAPPFIEISGVTFPMPNPEAIAGLKRFWCPSFCPLKKIRQTLFLGGGVVAIGGVVSLNLYDPWDGWFSALSSLPFGEQAWMESVALQSMMFQRSRWWHASRWKICLVDLAWTIRIGRQLLYRFLFLSPMQKYSDIDMKLYLSRWSYKRMLTNAGHRSVHLKIRWWRCIFRRQQKALDL